MYKAMVFEVGCKPKEQDNLSSYELALNWCRSNANYEDDAFVILDSKTQKVERCGIIDMMYEE